MGLPSIQSDIFYSSGCAKIMFTHHHRISKYAVYPCPPDCRFHAAVIAISLHWSSEAFLLISSIFCMDVPYPADMVWPICCGRTCRCASRFIGFILPCGGTLYLIFYPIA